jgi:hypothetical protein
MIIYLDINARGYVQRYDRHYRHITRIKILRRFVDVGVYFVDAGFVVSWLAARDVYNIIIHVNFYSLKGCFKCCFIP